MDTSAENIHFYDNGFCNYCTDYQNKHKHLSKKNTLEELLTAIKAKRKNNQYDCIVGLSGGIDSCYALFKAVEVGLKPLAVHMDNGWNSELAQNNISNLVNYLNVDLYTYVIDWEEYRNMQEAFLKANVVDVELLYDNAMMAVNYKIASKFKTKYILSGMNINSEGFNIPKNWSWHKNDARNISQIVKKFSNQKINTFPLFGTFSYIKYEIIKKIKWISFLDFIEYEKKKAIEELSLKTNFKKYPYKHYENIFTRFYQGYILPEKFGIDKRKMHLSNLIMSNQISREEGLREIQKLPYLNAEELEKDKRYFLKKMNWDKKKLENYILQKKVDHSVYGSEKSMWILFSRIYKLFLILKKIITLPR